MTESSRCASEEEIHRVRYRRVRLSKSTVKPLLLKRFLAITRLAGEEERLRFILQKLEVCGRRIPTCRLKSKAIENRGGKTGGRPVSFCARHREKRPPKRRSSDGVRPVKDDSLMTFGRNSVTEFLRADRVRSVFIKEGRKDEGSPGSQKKL